jgi:hypothetical protein
MAEEENKRTIVLNKGEYIIYPEDKTALDYKVYFKGKEINDVAGLIRIDLDKVR